MEDTAAVVFASAAIVDIIIARRRRKPKEWIQKRPSQGAFHQWMQELRSTDKQSYKNFLRMDVAAFEDLLSKVGPLITYRDTHLRKAISPGERLAVTLRFLATGRCFTGTVAYINLTCDCTIYHFYHALWL